jgi:hypothetical protein
MMTPFYMIYIGISLAITFWVGRTLTKNGRPFLVMNFMGNETLADSVNHLLLVGFYLINFGFISFFLKYGEKPNTLDQGIEFLSTKIGFIIIVLGVMHFINLIALAKFRHFRIGDQ